MSRNKRGCHLRQRRETKKSNHLLQSIGEVIAERRDELGLTQTEIARRVHVSRFQMCKHESGSAEMPVTRLSEVCGALRITMIEVLRRVAKSLKNGMDL